MDADDTRLLANLAKFPAMWPGSPADAARLERLEKTGYIVRDPKLKVATSYGQNMRSDLFPGVCGCRWRSSWTILERV